MRKLFCMTLVIMTFLLLSGTVLAFNTPAVNENQGVLTGTLYGDQLLLGVDYGLTPEWGITGHMGSSIRIGAKYELNNNLAITAGWLYKSPYIGVNGSIPIRANFMGIYETFLSTYGLAYQVGINYPLNQEFDLRGGFSGSIGKDSAAIPSLALGVGYHF